MERHQVQKALHDLEKIEFQDTDFPKLRYDFEGDAFLQDYYQTIRAALTDCLRNTPAKENAGEIICDHCQQRMVDKHGAYKPDTMMIATTISADGYDYTEYKRVIKPAPVENSGPVDDGSFPCVSCGKSSETSTVDGADMCFECMACFQASEYDQIKKKLIEMLEKFRPDLNPDDVISSLELNLCISVDDKAGTPVQPSSEAVRVNEIEPEGRG